MVQDLAAHHKILEQALDKFGRMGYKDLFAMLPGHRKPKPISGIKGMQIPDLTCRKRDPERTQIVLDVATCDSIWAESKSERWTLFLDFCEKTSSEFHIAVPQVCELSDGKRISGEELLALRFQELGIAMKGVKIWMIG